MCSSSRNETISPDEITIVEFQEGVHDLTEMTRCIRSAYRELSDMGLKYWATWQDEADTFKRATRGKCYLAIKGDQILGTIAYSPPETASECAWYNKPGIASFHQFAVDPEFQRMGIGSRLIDHVERIATQDGALEMALDTAEEATHLIRIYEKRGYRFVEYMDWDMTNYRSVIMSKKL